MDLLQPPTAVKGSSDPPAAIACHAVTASIRAEAW